MSEETAPKTESLSFLVTEEHLRKMLSELDFTRSQFEREKTARIVALSEALKSVAEIQTNSYGKSPRETILDHLAGVIAEQFNPIFR